jgi:hypothetical protein
MTGTIEFMEISEVFETMSWPPSEDMTIYVSIGNLGMFEARNDIVHRLLQAIVFGLLEVGRRSFQPLGKIRVPKDTGSPIPAVAERPATVRSLIEFERVDVSLSTHLRQLME